MSNRTSSKNATEAVERSNALSGALAIARHFDIPTEGPEDDDK